MAANMLRCRSTSAILGVNFGQSYASIAVIDKVSLILLFIHHYPADLG